MRTRLTPEQELELIEEQKDEDWSIQQLSVIYKISERTVYRILARHQNPRPKLNPRKVMPCGTNAAYQRHRRKGEYPCPKCLEAHAADVALYSKPKPKSTRKLAPCGTHAAYKRHRKNGEEACFRCLKAHAKYLTIYRKRKRNEQYS
jgi:hypothetical protein